MPHRLTWESKDSKGNAFRDFIVRALNQSYVGATLQSLDGRYIYIANLPDCWHVNPETEPHEAVVFGDRLGGTLSEIRGRVKQNGDAESLLTSGPDERRFEFIVTRTGTGPETMIHTTIIELTEEHRREQMLRALLREVSHRSKNLLAIILSIVSQTARGASTLSTFLPVFRGRIYSLAQSQDLVTDSSWRGAQFRELVRAQAAKYLDEAEAVLTVTGADPLLSPNEALHVGLALHELLVDALAAAAALGMRPDIRVDCAASDTEPRQIDITWSHTANGPDFISEAGQADAFASVVLDRITPVAVQGTGKIERHDDLFVYRLSFAQAPQA
ncbi:HWE histidine kinase domain-containing protein [Zhengella sp. ZM62]|uniref:HWE histidine kinase domain-containing protein n=1 Tax=Zhengella sedimenti TaxID=3390035 RepID=UPI0039760AE0